MEKLQKQERSLRDKLVEAQNAHNTLQNSMRELQEHASRKEQELKEVQEKCNEVSRYAHALIHAYTPTPAQTLLFPSCLVQHIQWF